MTHRCRPAAGLLNAALLACAWQGMLIVHEAGHCLHAWWSGGHVERVVLHPLAISRTDVRPNPRPQFVAWGGPIWGCVIPLLCWLTLRQLQPQSLISAAGRFFVGFCCIANGAYLGVGWMFPVGDAADLLRTGAPGWTLGLFGLLSVPVGLRLWHGLGSAFGIGPEARDISWRSACSMTAAALGLAVIQAALFGRG